MIEASTIHEEPSCLSDVRYTAMILVDLPCHALLIEDGPCTAPCRLTVFVLGIVKLLIRIPITKDLVINPLQGRERMKRVLPPYHAHRSQIDPYDLIAVPSSSFRCDQSVCVTSFAF